MLTADNEDDEGNESKKRDLLDHVTGWEAGKRQRTFDQRSWKNVSADAACASRGS